VLDAGVVFGRACGAASTTLSGEKTTENTLKTHTQITKNTYKTYKAELRAPPPLRPRVTKQNQREPKNIPG